MSESLRRKSSSRQLLQNLIRVTAQRSQEDAEELERERRRRSREKERGEGSPSWSEPPQHNDQPNNTEARGCRTRLPAAQLVTSETLGSPGEKHQLWEESEPAGKYLLGSAAAPTSLNGSPLVLGVDKELKPSCCLVLEEDEGFSDWSHRLENRTEPEVTEDCGATVQRPLNPKWKPEPGEEKQQEDEEEEPERSGWSQEASPRPPEKRSSNRKEVRTSYSSTVFVPQESKLHRATDQPTDRMSYLAAMTMKSCGDFRTVKGQEEAQATLPTEQRSAESRQSPREEDDLEEEELSFTYVENEEEHKMSDKKSAESRRNEEASRRSTSSLSSSSSSKGEESLTCYGPMSPTFKKLLIQFYPDEVNNRVSADGKCTITERTESLRRSTNSIKKTLLPAAVSKIDKKLEQYTHALEVSSKEGRSGTQVLTDLTAVTEPVLSKKNLFEGGDAWNQNVASVTPSKDADGLKVGVANLINQWVRGSEDGSRCSSPFKPADGSSGKRYKFVVTGHGKYEKVSVDDGCEDTICHSAQPFYEDL